jgi:chaperonin GroES
MKIRPVHDRVVVRRMEEDRTSPGGILIPDAAAEKPIKGEVIAVGNDQILESGEVRALDVKTRDKVLFGNPIQFPSHQCLSRTVLCQEE